MQDHHSEARIDGARLQKIIAEIWKECLQREQIVPTDEFFSSGGDSLSATTMLMRIREELGVQIGLRVVFEERSLQAFSAAVGRSMSDRVRDMSEDELMRMLD